MDAPHEAMGMICSECYWEDDPTDSEYGPNSVFLEEARKNYQLYGACDPHGYWCKWYRELPSGVADGDRLAVLAWRAGTSCPKCHSRWWPAEKACSDCGYHDE